MAVDMIVGMSEASHPLWVTAYLDLAPEDFGQGLGFWSAVTGYVASDPRGDELEFATVLPPQGDPCLGVQRLSAGGSRIHLALHVCDAKAASEAARTLGATVGPS